MYLLKNGLVIVAVIQAIIAPTNIAICICTSPSPRLAVRSIAEATGPWGGAQNHTKKQLHWTPSPWPVYTIITAAALEKLKVTVSGERF